jgi:hypothetical protein
MTVSDGGCGFDEPTYSAILDELCAFLELSDIFCRFFSANQNFDWNFATFQSVDVNG